MRLAIASGTGRRGAPPPYPRAVVKGSTVPLHIVVATPPDAAERGVYGLQAKHGSVRDGRQNPDGSMTFECEVRVATSASGRDPNFLGKFTHGPPSARHLYISHRAPGTAAPEWTRRTKLPLASITWADLEAAGRDGLRTMVEGRSSGTVPVDWGPT